ncbi:MAG: substrate-binding domain-containing protein [Bacillota bacterium]
MGSLTFKWLGLITALLLLIGGCSPKPQKKPLPPRLKIAVAVSDLEWDGMQVMRKTLEKRSKNERLDVTWLDAKNDPREQKKQIEQLLKKTGRQKAKVVVLQAVDPLQSSPLVENLARARIKVLALENLIPNAPLDGYIAFDHFRAGQLQARYGLSAAGPQKPLNVLILKGDPGDPAAQEITEGIRSAFNENVRVVKEVEHVRNDQGRAALNVQQALKENKIAVIFATDSRLAAGAAAALKSAGLSEQVVTAGVGADRTAARALIAGEHDAEVDTMPELMGQYILDAAVSLAKTGHWQYDTRVSNGNYSVPAKITPVRLIDQTNGYLLEQRWGKELRKERGRSAGQRQGEGGSGGDAEGTGEEGQSEGEQGGREGEGKQPEGGRQKAKTKLRITTQEGKTIEVEIPGEIKRIESSREGQAKQEGAGGA